MWRYYTDKVIHPILACIEHFDVVDKNCRRGVVRNYKNEISSATYSVLTLRDYECISFHSNRCRHGQNNVFNTSRTEEFAGSCGCAYAMHSPPPSHETFRGKLIGKEKLRNRGCLLRTAVIRTSKSHVRSLTVMICR